MASQELSTVISMLKLRSVNPNPTVEEMRAGIEVLCTVFPVSSDVALEPSHRRHRRIHPGGLSIEVTGGALGWWISAPSRRSLESA